MEFLPTIRTGYVIFEARGGGFGAFVGLNFLGVWLAHFLWKGLCEYNIVAVRSRSYCLREQMTGFGATQRRNFFCLSAFTWL